MDRAEVRIVEARPVPHRALQRTACPVAGRLTAVEAFEHHRLELERYLTRLTHDPDEAAEVAQETFLRLIREERAGRAPDRVRGWLYRVAENVATSRARHRSVAARHAAIVGREVAGFGQPPEDGLLARDDCRRVRAALADMSPDARTAILLAAEGYSGREIAARIGRSEPATRTLLSRSRGRVRRLVRA